MTNTEDLRALLADLVSDSPTDHIVTKDAAQELVDHLAVGLATVLMNPEPTAERGPEVPAADLPPATRVNVGPGGSLDLDNVFTYHPPTGDQIARYADLRSTGRLLATSIDAHCPPSPERSTAIAKVREAVMWANAAIACNEPPAP